MKESSNAIESEAPSNGGDGQRNTSMKSKKKAIGSGPGGSSGGAELVIESGESVTKRAARRRSGEIGEIQLSRRGHGLDERYLWRLAAASLAKIHRHLARKRRRNGNNASSVSKNIEADAKAS